MSKILGYEISLVCCVIYIDPDESREVFELLFLTLFFLSFPSTLDVFAIIATALPRGARLLYRALISTQTHSGEWKKN